MRSYLIIGTLLFSFAVQAEVINVESLNNKLIQTNAGWVAKKNHLTEMSQQEVHHMMGLRVNKRQDVDFVTPRMKTFSNLPSQLDWRNKDGKNWVSPILDQANCGSCVAFASIGVLETQYKISSTIPNFNIKLSPQHLFACGGGACNWGWMPESAARYLQKKGVPDEACLPYTSGATGSDVSCQSSCADSAQRSVRISSYTTPTRGSTDIEAVKQALQSGPVVTTLGVYSDFMAYAGGVYKHVTGKYEGGHAISIIGYDDTKQAFIIRNSWGEEWGEKGFGYVSYDDTSGVGDDTWLYSLPAMGGGVSVESPTDYTYVTGKLPFSTFSSFSSTDSLSAAIYNSQNKAVLNVTCAGASCAQDVDVSSLPDGRYEIQSFAMNNRGENVGTSERHFFYIVNKAPQMSITFKGANGTDLTKSLRERIEMDITTTTSSVPFSSIEYRFSGPKSGERSANVVPSKMVMGWRTNLVPNGTYELWFVGHLKSNGMDLSVESAHQTVQVKN